MSTLISRRQRRNKKRIKTPCKSTHPMELLGFEGSRHMIPERLPSAKKEKPVNVRMIELNSTAMDQIKENAETIKRLDLSCHNLLTLNEEFIASLRSLERIDLSQNRLNEDTFPKVFKKLENLIEVNISMNRFTVLPPVLRRLKELKRLKVGSNRLTTAEGLEKLKKLQILLLDANEIESLPKEVYKQLKRLEIFHISCNKLKEIHVDIRFLRYLTDVNVSSNNLISLPSELLLLPRLEVLNASANQIARIPTLNVKGKLHHKIAHVDLSENVLIKFPVHLLLMTEKLDICKNRIKTIPTSIMKKLDVNSGQELVMHDNPLIYPPADICDSGIKSILQFFRDAQAEMVVYQGIKVLVLGASGSGKTSLIQTLVDQQSRLTGDGDSTIGVDMYDMDMDIKDFEKWRGSSVDKEASASSSEQSVTSLQSERPKSKWKQVFAQVLSYREPEGRIESKKSAVVDPKTMQVSLWDFSGNKQYLQSHTFFIQDPALVIIAFNMATYNEENFQDFIGEWMNLCITKNDKITVLPVGTMVDAVPEDDIKQISKEVLEHMKEYLAKKKSLIQKEIDKIESMPHIPHVMSEQLKNYLRLLKTEVYIHDRVIPVSSARYQGINNLCKTIEKIALNLELFPNVMRSIPSLWSEVENYIEDKAWSNSLPYMRWAEYSEEITEKFGMKHLLVPITQYLNDIGKVIWLSDNSRLKDFVFLRGSWLADVMKHIFRHNVADIDYSMEENFKQNGISLEKFENFTGAILAEGLMERDYLKGAWYGLVPYDSTKSIVEVLVILLEQFEIGYPYVKPGTSTTSLNQSRLTDRTITASAASNYHGYEQHQRGDNNSRLSATYAAIDMSGVGDAQDGKLSALASNENFQSKSSKKKHGKDTKPLPKISKVIVPFIRKIDKPQEFVDQYNTCSDNPCLVAVYKFPWYSPPGLFETVCVRALKEDHKCTLLYQWNGGFYAQIADQQHRLLIERKSHQDKFSYIRIELCLKESCDNAELENLWTVLLPLLKDVEDILSKFTGAWIQRHSGCPECRSPFGFFGEWMNPKELQGLTTKKCFNCSKDVSTTYLVQPKEKKRVEEFLLKKLRLREAERAKLSSKGSIDVVKEERSNIDVTNDTKYNSPAAKTSSITEIFEENEALYYKSPTEKDVPIEPKKDIFNFRENYSIAQRHNFKEAAQTFQFNNRKSSAISKPDEEVSIEEPYHSPTLTDNVDGLPTIAIIKSESNTEINSEKIKKPLRKKSSPLSRKSLKKRELTVTDNPSQFIEQPEYESVEALESLSTGNIKSSPLDQNHFGTRSKPVIEGDFTVYRATSEELDGSSCNFPFINQGSTVTEVKSCEMNGTALGSPKSSLLMQGAGIEQCAQLPSGLYLARNKEEQDDIMKH